MVATYVPGPHGPMVFSIASAGGDSAAATNFLARTSGLNATHTNAYKALLNGLTTDGFFDGSGNSSSLDILYIFCTADQTTAVLNLVKASFNATSHGTVSFTADAGYTGNATDFYLDTGFTPSTAGGNSVAASTSMGAYVLSNRASGGNKYLYGADATSATFFNPYHFGSIVDNINSAGSVASAGSGTNGFWVQSLLSGTYTLYNFSTTLSHSGSIASMSSGTPGLPAASILISALDSGGATLFADDQIAAFFTGAGLSSTNVGKLSTRINTFMTTFSKNQY